MPLGGGGVGQRAADHRHVLASDLLGAGAARVAAQGDAQRDELAVDLGQGALRVEVAGGRDHLGQLGVGLGGLDGVEDRDAVVGGGVAQVDRQLGGGADPVVLGGLGAEGVGVHHDLGQAQPLQPGQGDGVALDDLQQAAEDGLAQVGVGGRAGGDHVDEALRRAAHRELEVDQDGRHEDLAAPGQGPAAHPAQRDPGVGGDEAALRVGQLRGRAGGPALRPDGGLAQAGRGVPDQLLGLPRAGGVALQGLHDRDVPGEVGVDGAAGAVDIAGLDPVVPGGLRAQRRGEVAEESGPDREGRLAGGLSQLRRAGHQADRRLEGRRTGQRRGDSLLERRSVHGSAFQD